VVVSRRLLKNDPPVEDALSSGATSKIETSFVPSVHEERSHLIEK